MKKTDNSKKPSDSCLQLEHRSAMFAHTLMKTINPERFSLDRPHRIKGSWLMAQQSIRPWGKSKPQLTARGHHPSAVLGEFLFHVNAVQDTLGCVEGVVQLSPSHPPGVFPDKWAGRIMFEAIGFRVYPPMSESHPDIQGKAGPGSCWTMSRKGRRTARKWPQCSVES